MTVRITELRRAAEQVAATGTDPDQLVALLLWSLAPGNHLDALRRRIRDGPGVSGAPALPLDGDGLQEGDGGGGRTPAARLVAAAGAVALTHAEDALAVLARWQDRQVRVALLGDPEYPRRLTEGWPHTDAPGWLAWRGTVPGDGAAVALVGARRATGYGTGVAAWLAEAAAGAGAQVVSGGAVGIDAAAHEAALTRPGGTTVVLGCGHDVLYPRTHARDGGLFDRILAAGGSLVSECLPEDEPRAHRIRARNRIVAGLADVVVVVEGRDRSGALLTASAALTRDRLVLAVPGDVRAPGSVAPHRLLVEGAAPCTGPGDLLAALRGAACVDVEVRLDADPDDPHGRGAVAISALPTPVRQELEQAWPRPLRLETLAQRSGTPVGELLAAVTRARVAGEVVEGHDGLRLHEAPPGAS